MIAFILSLAIYFFYKTLNIYKNFSYLIKAYKILLKILSRKIFDRHITNINIILISLNFIILLFFSLCLILFLVLNKIKYGDFILFAIADIFLITFYLFIFLYFSKKDAYGYSYLDKIFHLIALRSNIIKNLLFNVEQKIQQKKIAQIQINTKVFIIGLARSGTTALLNQLYNSGFYASITYKDIPLIFSPNLNSKINSHAKNKIEQKERIHNDGLIININSPEAFEEIYWQTFKTNKNFDFFIKSYLYKNKKLNYLSKNNQNIRRINLIKDKNSIIIIIIRDPLNNSYSLLNQHNSFTKLQDNNFFIEVYMNLIGHFEFGKTYKPLYHGKYNDFLNINHWLEQYVLVYSDVYQKYKDDKNILLIKYEDLCSSKYNIQRLYNRLGIDFDGKFEMLNMNKSYSTCGIDQKLLSKAKSIYKKFKN